MKGIYLKKVSVSSTMGVGIRVDHGSSPAARRRRRSSSKELWAAGRRTGRRVIKDRRCPAGTGDSIEGKHPEAYADSAPKTGFPARFGARALLTKGRYGWRWPPGSPVREDRWAEPKQRRKTLSLNLEEKKAVVAEVSARLAKAQTIVLAEYRGLPVEDITQLRAKARASGVYLRVLKNTLARRAVQGTPFEKLAEQMVGPLAYGISDDPVAAAKVLHEYAKGNDKLVIKGGAMPNQVMTAKEVANLATLPSREELLAKLMGTMQAPIAKFVQTLNEVPGKFVRDPRRGSRPEGKGRGLNPTTPFNRPRNQEQPPWQSPSKKSSTRSRA